MPIYSIMNTETDDVFEINVKYSELETYFKENPTHKQIYTRFPATVDPVRAGLRKPDDNFRDVLKNIKSHHKKNVINDF